MPAPTFMAKQKLISINLEFVREIGWCWGNLYLEMQWGWLESTLAQVKQRNIQFRLSPQKRGVCIFRVSNPHPPQKKNTQKLYYVCSLHIFTLIQFILKSCHQVTWFLNHTHLQGECSKYQFPQSLGIRLTSSDPRYKVPFLRSPTK